MGVGLPLKTVLSSFTGMSFSSKTPHPASRADPQHSDGWRWCCVALPKEKVSGKPWIRSSSCGVKYLAVTRRPGQARARWLRTRRKRPKIWLSHACPGLEARLIWVSRWAEAGCGDVGLFHWWRGEAYSGSGFRLA